MNNQVCHVSNEIGRQSQVEEHVKDVEEHFPRVLGVQISITCGGQCSDGPVQWCHISVPQTILFEIRVYSADPGPPWIGISVGDQIVDASGKVYSKKGHLKIHKIGRDNQNLGWMFREGRDFSFQFLRAYRDELCASSPEIVEADILLKPEGKA